MPSRAAAAAPVALTTPFTRSVLPNGLRVLVQPMAHARSVAMGLFVGVGSRYEAAEEAGLSHLLEHLVFKGTRAHPEPGGISQAIEEVGGSVNASTDRELTVYSVRVPGEHWRRGMEVLGELVLRPLLRRADLAAEKPVIVDEIRMYVDSPSDHVFTLFDELLFGDHPLGREIAGTPRSVRRARRETVAAHWARWYAPRHLVLAVAGAVEPDEVARASERWWEAAPDPLPTGEDAPAVRPPRLAGAGAMRISHRSLSQGNLCLGMPGVARDHPDRWALDLLGALLGDGMSCRLFVELRERRSLAYDVSTFASTYADCGTFGIHVGFDPDATERVVAAVADQLDRVVNEPVAQAELERARNYTRGRLELRLEETSAVASWLGTGESLLPRILTVEEVIERLEAVTVDDLQRVAQAYARPDQLRVAALGPFRGSSRFRRALRPWNG